LFLLLYEVTVEGMVLSPNSLECNRGWRGGSDGRLRFEGWRDHGRWEGSV